MGGGGLHVARWLNAQLRTVQLWACAGAGTGRQRMDIGVPFLEDSALQTMHGPPWSGSPSDLS